MEHASQCDWAVWPADQSAILGILERRALDATVRHEVLAYTIRLVCRCLRPERGVLRSTRADAHKDDRRASARVLGGCWIPAVRHCVGTQDVEGVADVCH